MMAMSLQVWSLWQTLSPLRTRILAQCGEAFQKEPHSSDGVVPMRAELWDANHEEERRSACKSST